MMISAESILAIEKDALPQASASLDAGDIAQLVEWLSLKDDALRYQAFLLLQNRSTAGADVYPYWDVFRDKLKSDNSYQRSLGAMLIAENARWDSENRMASAVGDYLRLLNDEKPITVRQCIQSLVKIVSYKPALAGSIADSLLALDLTAIRETMRKSVLLDILGVLVEIRKNTHREDIEAYLLSALSGEILDNKSKKQLRAQL